MTDMVDALLAAGEGARTEFKSGFPRRDVLGKILCSFANTGGGTLVIGVDDKGEVVGVADATTVTAALSRDAARILQPALPISASVVKLAGKDVVLVDVPAGSDRPYTFGRQIYVRKGAMTELADPQALRKLLTAMPRFELRWERRLAGDVAESDLDAAEIQKAVSSAQESFGYAFPDGVRTIARLEVLDLASHGQLQNGAVVLFGREPQRRFPQTRVRAVRFADDRGKEIVDNKIFVGHAFRLIDEVEQFVLSRIPVRSAITDARLDRGDRPTFPRTAIREALLNALQHREYESYDGSIIVRMGPSRLSIWNPGGLPEGMTLQELKGVHYSRPRNPDIAHVFFLRGLVERVGSGTGRILAALREVGLPDAEWRSVSGGLEIVLSQARRGSDLNDRQQALLAGLAEGESITLRNYWEQFAAGVSERQARADLSELVSRRLLTRRGTARSTRYERAEGEAGGT